MMVSKNGRDFIEAFERDRLEGYLCPAGVPTISRGITNGALKFAGLTIRYADGTEAKRVIVGKSITRFESDRIYDAALEAWGKDVQKRLKEPALQHEFDGLVSLSWNIGPGEFGGSTVLARFNRGDKAGAAAAFGMWNKATVKGVKVIMPGLVRRRRGERALFEGQVADALAIAFDNRAPMPQKVARPDPPKTMAQSKTGNASIVTGGAGAIVVLDGVGQVVQHGEKAKETAKHAGELVGLTGSPAILVGLGLLIILAAAFIWFDRRRKLRQELV